MSTKAFQVSISPYLEAPVFLEFMVFILVLFKVIESIWEAGEELNWQVSLEGRQWSVDILKALGE